MVTPSRKARRQEALFPTCEYEQRASAALLKSRSLGPKLHNLRMDPFERAESENAMGYQRWYADRMFLIAPAGGYVAQWLQSFREFPPRQKPGSFNLDRVMEAVSKGAGDK